MIERMEPPLQVELKEERKSTANTKKELSREYRDKIYMRKDIISVLSKYGELHQTTLLSHCGLNIGKHREIFDTLERKGFIIKTETTWISRRILKYSVTDKGLELFKKILEPYEEMFPRNEKHADFFRDKQHGKECQKVNIQQMQWDSKLDQKAKYRKNRRSVDLLHVITVGSRINAQ